LQNDGPENLTGHSECCFSREGKRDYAGDLALKYDAGLSALAARRKWLLPAFVFGLLGTAIVWVVALSFPDVIAAIYSNSLNSNLPSRYSNLISICLMSIPFAPAFLSAFALGNILFPTALIRISPSALCRVLSTVNVRSSTGTCSSLPVSSVR